jgi:glycosyltransferase involved in cell wall biosynthesis
MDQRPKISYLITCSNEIYSLKNLLHRIRFLKEDVDEVVLLLDSDCKDNPKTVDLFSSFSCSNVKKVLHSLNNNYSEHKNFGMTKCSGDYIMQIDADELPTETLLINIKDIIEVNSGIELFFISRINDFIGVTSEHARQWGWRLSPSTSIIHEKVIDTNSEEYKFLKNNGYILEETKNIMALVKIKYKAVLVNAYDPQGRLFLNKPDEIKWIGRLHEHIEGNKNFVYLPPDEDLALYHDKTIEKQVETNLRYNQKFTVKENQGFNLPK